MTEHSDHAVWDATMRSAVDWYVMLRAESVSERDREGFARWLKASPLNVREYLELTSLAQDLSAGSSQLPAIDGLLADGAASNVVPLNAVASPPSEDSVLPRARWRWALAASVLMLLIGATLLYRRVSVATQVYETAHGQQLSVRLQDGSELQLNSDSRVQVRYGRSARQIELQRGQALFKVMHEAQRDFRVAAGSTEVLAVGTQFDVYRHGAHTQVTVVEGRVRVRAGADAAAASWEVPAGRQLDVIDGTGSARSVDALQTTAWTHRQIAFTDRPIGEIIDEFNRYSPRRILMRAPTVAQVPISGVFDAYDTASFLDFLGRSEPVSIRQTEREVLVLPLPSDTRERQQ